MAAPRSASLQMNQQITFEFDRCGARKKASKTAAIAAIKENEEVGDEDEGDSDIDD